MYKPELTIQETLVHIERELRTLRLLFGIAIVILALVLAVMVPVLMPSILAMFEKSPVQNQNVMEITGGMRMHATNAMEMQPASTSAVTTQKNVQ